MRIKFISTMVVIMLLLVISGRATAVWVCCEGEEWLRWTKQTRSSYVQAYTKAIDKGFTRGCEAGISASQPQLTYDMERQLEDKCWKDYPISGRDSAQIESDITKFYLHYPRQRYLYISDILLDLHSGLSLEQIHRKYPPHK